MYCRGNSKDVLDTALRNSTIRDSIRIDYNKWPKDVAFECKGDANYAKLDNEPLILPHSFIINDFATTQLCSKLRIPVSYFKRCPDFLRGPQLEYWKTKHKRNYSKERYFLFRTWGEEIKGVLSDLYYPIDNTTILNNLNKVVNTSDLPSNNNWASITDNSMWVVISLLEYTDIIPVTVGLTIINSEVGNSSLYLKYMITWKDAYKIPVPEKIFKTLTGYNSLYHKAAHVQYKKQELVAIERMDLNYHNNLAEQVYKQFKLLYDQYLTNNEYEALEKLVGKNIMKYISKEFQIKKLEAVEIIANHFTPKDELLYLSEIEDIIW
jgi:hypothetical protein